MKKIKRMPFSGHMPQYADFQFDLLTAIVSQTQLNGKEIRKEHKILSEFYKKNPDIFYNTLYTTKELLEEKQMLGSLNEFEMLSLAETNRILASDGDMSKMFQFNTNFFLDDHRKAWRQLHSKPAGWLRDNEVVDINYYIIDTPVGFYETPIAETLPDGSLNTGSKLRMNILKVKHAEVIIKYQTLFN